MEMPFNLIWVIRPLTECLLTGGPIRPREAELSLEGPFVQPFQVELGYCEDSGCWYGLFDGLERMLDEALFRRFDGDVLEHHFDPRHGRNGRERSRAGHRR